MEENKCCPNGNCENGVCGKDGQCCHKHCCGKCYRIISKIMVPLILIAIAFLLGTMVGEKTNFRDKIEGKKFMNNIRNIEERPRNSASDSVTIEVLPTDGATDTNTPPVLE